MLSHTWPGNLRELRNGVERAVILAPGNVLTRFDLGLSTDRLPEQERTMDHAARVGAPISLAALEREHIAQIVAQSPSLEAAARTLDIDATTLQRKRKRFGLV
jgi:NtrC-family two-component system response regulator AlgB